MVDLMNQYMKIKNDIDKNIISTIQSGRYVNGPIVSEFANNLSKFLKVKNTIPCANGTDALQIAFMAIGLKPGDEIICPSWTYIATAEAAAILGVKVIFCDVDKNTFNITAELIEPHINKNTKAIVPVHLYGQSCEMNEIMSLAKKYDLKVIEDNAQAIGCKYALSSGELVYTGGIGDIGTTSFYPSKNLGCYGDGGALFTNNDQLASRIKMISNHGEITKYHHELIGCNSRLDSVQAEILDVKLNYLSEYNSKRNIMANNYNEALSQIDSIQTPFVIKSSTHVYHQYTIKIKDGSRDKLKIFLQNLGIPTMVYYPIPIHRQKPYFDNKNLKNTETLVNEVLSLPIHSEVESSNQDYIIEKIIKFYK